MEENYFRLNFPESLFPCNTPEYIHYYNIGARKKAYSWATPILFCGLARNCRKATELNHRRIQHFQYTADINIISNDSTDGTDEYITKYNIGYVLDIGVPPLQGKSLLRRTVMADMRNKYVPYDDHEYEYIVVYDMDIEGGFSYEGFLHSIGYLEEHPSVGAITANGIQYRMNEDNSIRDRIFYDTWAHRPLKNKEEDESKYNLLRFNRGETPFAVESNFGGMGIYRGSIFNKHTIQYTNEDCDHVTIHKQIREMGFKVVLNPSLIILYSPHYYANTP